MGVPKFFRYISERYPCLSTLAKEYQIPDFDNLYLDMNGIIHNCSHPNDFDPHFTITEEKIFASIFHYIEVLFNMIKPRKLFFMAVDGVAPRAKMNQQRARRFRTAKEAERKANEALKAGEKPLSHERFDSNCITPGTVFMDRLHTQLKYFVTSKISTDPLWQNCKIVLSGHQTPGEGEHKIMDYIRYLKTLPDYNENTRHCLYGLDADLIMLSLCTHEPHFCLLREKVQFSRRQDKKIMSPDEIEFYLLHLSLFREYLGLEFQELKDVLTFQYNLENIIDDWVLMGFLVGNDFIPNLPGLHINKGALPVLHKAYKEVLPTLEGYLNENGYLNLPRFQKFMEKLAEHDLETFEDTYANFAFLEEKTGRSFTSEKIDVKTERKSELEELIKATEELELTDGELTDENDENDTFLWEFCQHKKHYYKDKMEYSNVTEDVLKSQAEGYIRAIQWNLHYYYQGCQSWSWYYPHHYSPYISDIKDFKDLKLDFDLGKPFLPFEQLLAVLPAASKDLLPTAYHDLMTSANSPIKDFYPENFETDLNGKDQSWEAVVLIPFIDEKRLLAAMEPCNEKLTPEERKRNQHGPMHVFTYTSTNLGVYKALEYFPSVHANHALMKDVFREEISVEISKLKYGLRPGVALDVLSPGFPTLKHIPHTASLKVAKVKVFDYPSSKDNMILKLKEVEIPPLDELANGILGKIIYIGWPHLVESKVVAISDGKVRYFLVKGGEIKREAVDKGMHLQWMEEAHGLSEDYLKRFGVEIGAVSVVVHVKVLEGRKYQFGPMGTVTTEKIWSTVPTPSALQTTVRSLTIQNQGTFVDFRDAFPVNSVVFMLGQPHFGSMGRVLDSSQSHNNGRLRVELETVNDLILHKSFFDSQTKSAYFPCRVAALKVGVSPRLLSKITGSVFVSMTQENGFEESRSKINIGLNMKFFKKNEELPGYTKLENENWLYSEKAIETITDYIQKFPRVVEHLSNHPNTSVFYVQDIFPGPEGLDEMKEIVDWIKSQKHSKVERLKCGTEMVDSEVIAQIEKAVEKAPSKRFLKQMQIKPHLLYKNDLFFGNIHPVKSAKHVLLDRIVSIRSSYTVPTGLRGYIIAIHPAALDADYKYDVLFDEPFLGGMKFNCSGERVFRISRASFLNITDANRQSNLSALGSFHPVLNSNISLRPPYSEPKQSAFAQWSHEPLHALPPPNLSNEEFKKMWSNLQTVMPQEDALKKILKIEKKENEKIEEPVKSFFEKVSKVFTESPQISHKIEVPFIENTQSRSKYYLQLFSYHQKRNMGQPRFKYLYVGGKVMAQVYFNDGKVCSGLPCEDKESACESASLQALGALGEIPLNNEALVQKEREKKIIQNQIKLTNALVHQQKQTNQKRLPKPINCPTRTPPSLPNPPSQWVLGNLSQAQPPLSNPSKLNFHAPPKTESPDKFQTASNSAKRKLNSSALEFVPLQAITGKRNAGKMPTIQTTKQTIEPQTKTKVVATFINNAATPTSATKPKRKLKIAANLNLDPDLY